MQTNMIHIKTNTTNNCYRRVNDRETMGERDRGGRVLCVGGGEENVGGVRRRRRRRKVYSKLTQ